MHVSVGELAPVENGEENGKCFFMVQDKTAEKLSVVVMGSADLTWG